MWGLHVVWRCLLLCAALLLCTPRARATSSVELSVTADGNELQLEALEGALVQQFAGEPVRLVLWNLEGSEPPPQQRVEARLQFRPGGALLELELVDGMKRHEFVQGADAQLLARTIAIIIFHVLLDRPPAAPDQVETLVATDETDKQQPRDTDPESSSGPPDERRVPAVAPRPTENDSDTRSDSEVFYEDPALDEAEPTNKRPLRPWVSLTGFGLSAILIGPAIISANASAAIEDPPTGIVQTTDQVEEAEYVRLRTRGQNRMTAALVTSSVVLGATSIVLATAFTDWGREDVRSGFSVVSQPGGVGCRLFADF